MVSVISKGRFELRASSFELRASSFELRASSFELRQDAATVRRVKHLTYQDPLLWTYREDFQLVARSA
ncbi:hypothetical protein BTW08_01045 [Salinicola sp. MH3R3-1]|nr:hypothetical protein BTW08_01045 [Salinicola sp. MH3R3-1]